MRWMNEEFVLSDEPAEVDWPAVHALLAGTYWAARRPPEKTERATEHSVCFSLKTGGRQVGFARVLTDEGCYAVLLDVVVAEEFRGRGLGRWMIERMVEHPRVRGLRIVLWTTDHVRFYEAAGFTHEETFALLGMKPDWA